MVASFHCLGISPVFHTLTSRLREYRINLQLSSFSTSAGIESGLTAFQFGIPRITPIMSSVVGSTPRDGAKGRCGNRAVTRRSRLVDVLFRRVWKTPPHRLRMRSLSLSSVPSSSVMNCFLFAFRPPDPTVPFKCLKKHHWSLSASSLSVQQGTLQSRHVILRQSPLADSHTPSSASSTRLCLQD